MPDIQITDDLGQSVPSVKIDLTQPSSLLTYARMELLHLTVAPEFIARAPQLLSAAAPNPISFQLKLQHKFQLGQTKPEVDLTPSMQAAVRVNTTKGTNLFDADAFRVPAVVPDQTGYVSLAFQGSLDLGVSGSAGDLTFGLDPSGTFGIEYWKAFPLGAGEPTLGEAAGRALSGLVIPASIDDLKLMALNDVCTVSGQGSLKVSGGFSVSAAPNPLASVNLPLNVGKLEVKTGAMAGISASFTIRGSYQIRARRTSADNIELSYYKQQGTTLQTDLSASGGVSVTVGATDLLKSLVGAISTNPNDDATKKLFEDGGLAKDEIATLTQAIKDGLDHSLQASLDLALSQLTDTEAAFQYEVQTALLDATAGAAVNRALMGDLSGLTELEAGLTALEAGDEGAQLAPGVKMLSSVLTKTRKIETTFKLNLLGLVNLISISDLIRKSVAIKDPDTGYLTIADSATGDRINAEVEPLRRQQALRKAMFESLMLTATYRVTNTISMQGLTSHNFHFAFQASTDTTTLADYLSWLVALNLLTKEQANDDLKQFPGGGPSTCLLRTEFDQDACQSMFFQSPGQLWDLAHYLQIGRQAMRALIDPTRSDKDRYRCQLLDQHWTEAVKKGPTDELALLVGLHLTDFKGQSITGYLRNDVATIKWWAKAMRSAGEAIVEFDQDRDRLHKSMATLIGESQAQFDEPWGLVALFWAAGSRGASARLVCQGFKLYV